MTEINIDTEFASCIPPLSADERLQLEANLVSAGRARDKLVVWGGPNILVDGHNRYDICTKHGLPFEVEYEEFESRDAAKDWIIDNQLGRRNLEPNKASYLRGQRYLSVASRKKGRPCNTNLGDETASSLAEALNVSPATLKRDVSYAVALDKIGEVEPELKHGLLSGDIKASRNDVIALAADRDASLASIKQRAKSSGALRRLAGKEMLDVRGFERAKTLVGGVIRTIDALNNAQPAHKFHRDAQALLNSVLVKLDEWKVALS